MKEEIWPVFISLGWPPLAGYVCRCVLRLSLFSSFYEAWTYGAIGSGFAWIFPPDSSIRYAGLSWLGAIVAAYCWWLSRRRKKRAPRSYGAKAAALIAALVRKVRASGPVRSPLPQGA